jgi:hypothetical protein
VPLAPAPLPPPLPAVAPVPLAPLAPELPLPDPPLAAPVPELPAPPLVPPIPGLPLVPPAPLVTGLPAAPLVPLTPLPPVAPLPPTPAAPAVLEPEPAVPATPTPALEPEAPVTPAALLATPPEPDSLSGDELAFPQALTLRATIATNESACTRMSKYSVASLRARSVSGSKTIPRARGVDHGCSRRPQCFRSRRLQMSNCVRVGLRRLSRARSADRVRLASLRAQSDQFCECWECVRIDARVARGFFKTSFMGYRFAIARHRWMT